MRGLYQTLQLPHGDLLRFAEVAEAYRVPSQPNNRRPYDQFGGEAEWTAEQAKIKAGATA